MDFALSLFSLSDIAISFILLSLPLPLLLLLCFAFHQCVLGVQKWSFVFDFVEEKKNLKNKSWNYKRNESNNIVSQWQYPEHKQEWKKDKWEIKQKERKELCIAKDKDQTHRLSHTQRGRERGKEINARQQSKKIQYTWLAGKLHWI